MKKNDPRRAPREVVSGDGPVAAAPPISRGKAKAFEKSLTTAQTAKHILRLYVAGATDRSRQAILRARQLCEAQLKDNYELEVIDVYQQPLLARNGQIVATPTLVQDFPPPVRRLIGSLANTTALFVGLDLNTKGKCRP